MKLIRWIVKIILLPVACVLTLIQWIGIFLNSISGVVMGILSFLFVLTGTASLLFGLASGPEFVMERRLLIWGNNQSFLKGWYKQ